MYPNFFSPPRPFAKKQKSPVKDRFIPPPMTEAEWSRAHLHLTQRPTPADHNPDLVYQSVLSEALLGVSPNEWKSLPIIPVRPQQRLKRVANRRNQQAHLEYIGLNWRPPIYTLNSANYSRCQPVLNDFSCNPMDWQKGNIFSASRQDIFVDNIWTKQTSWLNEGHNGGYITCLKSTADGETCITAETEISRGITAWDVQTTQPLSSLDSKELILNLCSYTDKTSLASSIEGGLYLFDQRSAEMECLGGNQSYKQMPGLTYNGENLIATGDQANEVLVWDKRNFQQPLMTFTGHQSCVRALSFSPHNSQLLASGGGKADQTIKIWDARTGELTVNAPADSAVASIDWLDRNNVVTAHGFPEGGDVRTWSYQPGKNSLEQTFFMALRGRERVLDTALSPGKDRIAVLSSLDRDQLSGFTTEEQQTSMGTFDVFNIRLEEAQAKKREDNDLARQFTIR